MYVWMCLPWQAPPVGGSAATTTFFIPEWYEIWKSNSTISDFHDSSSLSYRWWEGSRRERERESAPVCACCVKRVWTTPFLHIIDSRNLTFTILTNCLDSLSADVFLTTSRDCPNTKHKTIIKLSQLPDTIMNHVRYYDYDSFYRSPLPCISSTGALLCPWVSSLWLSSVGVQRKVAQREICSDDWDFRSSSLWVV